MAGVRGKFHWNGKDLPQELHDLPPGTYIVESIDQPPLLTEAEEAGLSTALASLRAGKVARSNRFGRRSMQSSSGERCRRTPVTDLPRDVIEAQVEAGTGPAPPGGMAPAVAIVRWSDTMWHKWATK
jgi:hypothetical protein